MLRGNQLRGVVVNVMDKDMKWTAVGDEDEDRAAGESRETTNGSRRGWEGQYMGWAWTLVMQSGCSIDIRHVMYMYLT